MRKHEISTMAARVAKLRRLFRNGNPPLSLDWLPRKHKVDISRRARHRSGKSESRQATGFSRPRFATTLEDDAEIKIASAPQQNLERITSAHHSGIAGDLSTNGGDRYAEIVLQIRAIKMERIVAASPRSIDVNAE
jgi:hypothetical protein